VSIGSVNEMFDTQRSAAIDDSYTRTYERVFIVITDGTDGPIAVREASGVPQLYTYFAFATGTGAAEADTLALCRSVRSEQQADSPRHWRVYCSYDSTYNPAGDDSGSPLNQPAVISGGSVTYEVPMHEDLGGHKIANSAGDPYDPPPMFDRARATIKVQKNLALTSFSPVTAVNNVNKVNSATYLSIGSGNLKCQGVSYTEQEEQGLTYWNTEWEFLFDEDDWNPVKILDAGYRQRKAGSTTSTPITDPLQNGPINSPWPLLPSGVMMPDPTVAPNYKEFIMYGIVDFNSLGIIP
jgi:hypothetical protein